MMSALFWPSGDACAAIGPDVSRTTARGRVDDRRVISGIPAESDPDRLVLRAESAIRIIVAAVIKPFKFEE